MANVYRFRQWSLTFLRLVLGFIFLYHGYLKLFVPNGFKGTIAFFASIGIPYPTYCALLVAVVELIGGLFLIFGFIAKWTSLVIIIEMLVALFKVHLKNGFLITNNGAEYVALIIVSLLVILLNGSGSLSLDKVVFKTEEKPEERTERKKSRKKRVQVKDIENNGVIAKTGIEKEHGYLYFLDKKGDVARVQMARRGEKRSKKHEVIAKVGVKRKEGYLYFIDKDGNVSQAKMARG